MALIILGQLSGRERAGQPAQPTTAASTTTAGAAGAADDHGNSGPAATTIASLPATLTGTLAPAGDVDVFRLTARAGQTIVIELRLGTLTDGIVALVASGGNELANETASGNNKLARITHQLKDAGVYFVNVRGVRGTTGSYQLALSAK